MITQTMDLVMRAQQEETFLRERNRLLNFIKSRVATVEEAEDILQDVFYQFVAGYQTIESLDRTTSWLFSVARNKIIDRYRKQASRPLMSDFAVRSGSEDDIPLTLTEILPDLGNTPEDALLRETLWETIMEALDELPDEQREVFVLNEIEEKSFREIAEETGISINTLLSRKRYAIIALRKRLLKLYEEL